MSRRMGSAFCGLEGSRSVYVRLIDFCFILFYCIGLLADLAEDGAAFKLEELIGC